LRSHEDAPSVRDGGQAMSSSTAPRAPTAVGWYLAVVQLAFSLTWVVYVIYLPQLLQAAGLPRGLVPWLLMMDQLIFIVCDLAVGLASDRAAGVLGRLGRWMVAATLLSMVAFLALPFVAGAGPLALIACTLVWAVTSSLLRAPPLTLLGRYVAKPAQPKLLALMMLGNGVAAALAPYLGLVLKAWDPRGPFVLSSLALGAVTLGMVAAERALARGRAESDPPIVAATAAGARPAPASRPIAPFLLAVVLAALAFQLLVNVVQAPLYLRQAAAADLPWLMPLFWLGFNLALMPASLATKRWGGLPVMAVGGALAALAGAAASVASLFAGAAPLGTLLALAGAGWALLLMSAFASVLWFGAGGREGRLGGALNAVLAGAALLRMAGVTWLAPAPALAADLAWWPALGFALVALWFWALRQRMG
jgi:hypothetical protein